MLAERVLPITYYVFQILGYSDTDKDEIKGLNIPEITDSMGN